MYLVIHLNLSDDRLFPEYTKNSYKNNDKQANKKTARHLIEEDIQLSKKHVQRCST